MRDKTDAAIRRGLKRIIERAGMTPWPRTTHNLRSSRQTELCERFPAHVVSAWLDDSTDVADKHYLQLTDDPFQKATAERVQNRVQQPAALTRRVQSGATREARNPLFQGVEAKKREWMGIEPTRPLFRGLAGFEARGSHQIYKHSRS